MGAAPRQWTQQLGLCSHEGGLIGTALRRWRSSKGCARMRTETRASDWPPPCLDGVRSAAQLAIAMCRAGS